MLLPVSCFPLCPYSIFFVQVKIEPTVGQERFVGKISKRGWCHFCRDLSTSSDTAGSVVCFYQMDQDG